MKFNWKIGGEAGFGIMTAGLAFAKIATRSGYHIFDYSEYPSLIRGGQNTVEVAISDIEVSSMKQEVDLLVCLNKDTYTFHKHRLHKESIVIYDPEELEITENVVKMPVPFKKFKREFVATQVMINTVAIGASIGALLGDINLFFQILEKEFARKGQEVVDYNKKFAQAGYDYVTQNHPHSIKPVLQLKTDKEKVIMTANDAFSYGTVMADCRYFAAYPMTPSSSVLATLAGWQVKTGMIVRHSEDEIAVINSALGASFAGARSAVSTSGGGFALMVESISMAGITELPVVIYLGQRPGPATGMPTWTEQGDLLFAVHAGHGEFPKVVLTPGDINEMIELTAKAFDIAEIYQIPVIVMSDKLICESHKSEYKEDIVNISANYQPDNGKTVRKTSQEKYLRYKLSDDGISERLLPGQPGQFYQANSYEHLEDSHTSEEALPRVQQVDKRSKKTETYLKNHFQMPRIFGNIDEAEIIFVSWGGNKGIITDAQKMLSDKKTAYIHFTHVFPLDVERIKPLFKEGKRYILIENNSHAQFGKLLRMETGIEIKEKLLKYDGRPFWPEEIVEYVNKSNL